MKNKSLKRITLLVVYTLLLVCSDLTIAQEIMKHPRVVELEDSLKDSASEYVKSRFPSIPFMVTVRVDPLRRDIRGRAGYNESAMPYFDPEEDEEMKDEWDNPQVPLKALINRVKRITVSLSVPASLREADVNELKDSIFSVLHLTPARDEVQVARRDWIMKEVPWISIYAGAAILSGLLIGLLIINRSSANRIARALSEIKLNGGTQNGGLSNALPTADFDKKGEADRGQELTFNDPIKMKELAARHIQFLMSSPNFPNHRDIFTLDKLGQRKADKLGAILAEFPAEMQSQLFAYSSGFHWIEGLNQPGSMDFECLEVIQTLAQNPRKADDLVWDRAVLAVWRLDERRTQFIKSLPKDEAFALLSEMPKAIAVHEARKAFPGSWAAVLEPSTTSAKIAKKRAQEIEKEATQVLPLNQIELVQRYRAEQELLDYLKTVDPAEESDIYGALDGQSLVHKLRAPFFPIFEQPQDVLQWLVPQVSVDQWALALFNLPKSERVKIDALMNEKQRFLLVERFKKFDQNAPDRSTVGLARETIARLLKRTLTERANAESANSEVDKLMSTEAPGDETRAA